jgi:hypothetical protein
MVSSFDEGAPKRKNMYRINKEGRILRLCDGLTDSQLHAEVENSLPALVVQPKTRPKTHYGAGINK